GRFGEGFFSYHHVAMCEASAQIVSTELDHHQVRGAKEDFVVRLTAARGDGGPVLLNGLRNVLCGRSVAEGVCDDRERTGPRFWMGLEASHNVSPAAHPLVPAYPTRTGAQG